MAFQYDTAMYVDDIPDNFKRYPSRKCSIRCEVCQEDYLMDSGTIVNYIREYKKGKTRDYLRTCKACRSGTMLYSCTQCNKKFRRVASQIASTNLFCSQSCSATYNNIRKKHGVRRSKAEQYLCQLLSSSNIEFVANDRTLIPSGLEIDCYLPALNLAIELNGPVHYQPIYGEDKLGVIKEKDKLKSIELQQRGIALAVIDVTQSRFKDTKRVIHDFLKTIGIESEEQELVTTKERNSNTLHNFCVDCNAPISKKAKRCRNCATRKIDLPPREELQKMVDASSLRKVGEQLGVSYGTVYKRIKG